MRSWACRARNKFIFKLNPKAYSSDRVSHDTSHSFYTIIDLKPGEVFVKSFRRVTVLKDTYLSFSLRNFSQPDNSPAVLKWLSNTTHGSGVLISKSTFNIRNASY